MKKQLLVHLTTEDHEFLRKESFETGLSMAELLRQGILNRPKEGGNKMFVKYPFSQSAEVAKALAEAQLLETVIEWPAIEVAHKLAVQFGHEWGKVDLSPLKQKSPEGLTVPQIEHATFALDLEHSWASAIIAPYLTDESEFFNGAVLAHTTATGRYRWEINIATGDITCVISRPCSDIVRIVMTASGQTRIDFLAPEKVEERHREAVLEFLEAFMPHSTAAAVYNHFAS